ncbi:MAG: transglycosylase SLT domain-containing protein [Rhodobacteraceae bacterium]|nr:transglycosylase SLT domain-containing protein [Paracoccaceae bacterium]
MRSDLLLMGVGLMALGFIVVKRGVEVPKILSYSEALSLADAIDQRDFGGWFSSGGRDIRDVVAIWKIESALDAHAVGDFHLSDKSWGLGQVRGSTAAEFGVTSSEAMLNPTIGAWASMKTLHSMFFDLSRRFGRAPTLDEWVAAYNAGARRIAESGIINAGYVAKWHAARGVA